MFTILPPKAGQSQLKGLEHPLSKPFMSADGTIYGSLREAAKALGCDFQLIHYYLKKGKEYQNGWYYL